MPVVGIKPDVRPILGIVIMDIEVYPFIDVERGYCTNIEGGVVTRTSRRNPIGVPIIVWLNAQAYKWIKFYARMRLVKRIQHHQDF